VKGAKTSEVKLLLEEGASFVCEDRNVDDLKDLEDVTLKPKVVVT